MGMKRRSSGVLTVIWQLLWPILLYTVITMVIAMTAGVWLGTMWILFTAASVTSVILFYYYEKIRQEGRRSFGPSWRVRMDMGSGAVLLFVMACASCVFFNNLLEISGITSMSDSFEEISEEIYSVSVWVQILCVGLAAPVVEELIFRGMGYGRLRRVMGIVPAVIISSLVFGLYHGNLVQAVYAFFLGIMMALVYEHFDGLIPAIWFHIAANLMSIALSSLGGRCPSFFEGNFYLAGGTIISGLVTAGGICAIYDRKRRIRK